MAGVWERILIAAGRWQPGRRRAPAARSNVSVIVEQNGRRERGGQGGGGRTDYRFFTEERVMGYAREALRQALVEPGGDPGTGRYLRWCWVRAGRACCCTRLVGDGLEGDLQPKGSSAFSGRIGEKVASSLCTIVDDGTLEGRRGSLSVDDQAPHPAHQIPDPERCAQGRHAGTSLMRADGHGGDGVGRRESYAHLPMPRMTNTDTCGRKLTRRQSSLR